MIQRWEELSNVHKEQFIELFAECFIKDIDKKLKFINKEKVIFESAFLPGQSAVYIKEGKVAGFVSYSDMNSSAVSFKKSICRQQIGVLIGGIVYKMLTHHFGRPSVYAKDEGYIDFLCVKEDYHRMGIATELLEYAFNVQDKEYYLLYVLSKNEGAKKLYKKLGFVKTNTKSGFLMRILLRDKAELMRYKNSK